MFTLYELMPDESECAPNFGEIIVLGLIKVDMIFL